jgi:hypothetical protein
MLSQKFKGLLQQGQACDLPFKGSWTDALGQIKHIINFNKFLKKNK